MRKDEVILKIAKKYFYSIESRGDLKSRYNDNEDFIDVAVLEYRSCTNRSL